MMNNKKFLFFWDPYCIYSLCCVTHYFCSEINSVLIQIQYKFYSNKIVINFITTRKHQAAPCYTKMQYGSWMNGNFMVIITLPNKIFHHIDDEPKNSCSFDTHIVFIHCVALRITFVHKFILFGPMHSTNSTETQ